jgi:26S proteasome regulatory subunit N11
LSFVFTYFFIHIFIFKMNRAMQQMRGMGLGAPAPPDDGPQNDTAEKIQISSLSLLKMLKHGKAGIPMEVMGLMLGDMVDEYTITCVDVFAMPQHGTGASVEAIDETYQVAMLEALKQTHRQEMVVGWYHSHPGFGCWLSSVDINTQTTFEQLNPRCAAVVIDPVQSVKGRSSLMRFVSIPRR